LQALQLLCAAVQNVAALHQNGILATPTVRVGIVHVSQRQKLLERLHIAMDVAETHQSLAFVQVDSVFGSGGEGVIAGNVY
jgi:hypothetical protein